MRLAMRVAQALAVLMVLWPLEQAAYGEEKVDLNGVWQFRIDPSESGQQMGWMREMPAETETVRVPHTWNMGKYDDYEGTA